MKYCFISKYADSIGIIPHIEAEGHEVVYYIHDKSFLYSQIGDGYIKKVSSISEGVKDADYIIFDTTGFGTVADRLRKAGKKVWGGCSFADKLEHDRYFALELVKQLGLRIPRSVEVTKQEALEYLKQEQPQWILKTNIDISSLTFIPESNEYLAKFIEAEPLLNNTKFILQEYVSGVEVSTNIFYIQGRKIPNPDWTLETKRFLPHNLGMNTGCMTSLVGVYPVAEPRLYQKTLKKCEYLFEKMELNTCVDINTIIDKNTGEPYFLEFTPRLGYNWLYAYLPTLDITPAEFFAKLCENTLEEIPVRYKVGTAIRISVPPYPLEIDTNDKNIQKYFKYPVIVEDLTRVYLVGVKKTEGGFVVANPIVAEVSEVGNDWRAVFEQCYKNTAFIQVANKQFRTDGIRDADFRLRKLTELAYFRKDFYSV